MISNFAWFISGGGFSPKFVTFWFKCEADWYICGRLYDKIGADVWMFVLISFKKRILYYSIQVNYI